MRLILALALCILIPARGIATTLCDEVKLCLADINRVPKEYQPYTRYVSLYNLVRKGPKTLSLHEKIVLLFIMNSLSLEPEFARPVKISPTLYRVTVTEYGEKFEKAWEQLAKTNPYFPCFEKVVFAPAVPAKLIEREEFESEPYVDIYIEEPQRGLVKITRAQAQPGRTVYVRDRVGGTLRKLDELPPLKKIKKEVRVEENRKEVEQPKEAVAFLPAQEMQDLANLTRSKAPLVRADWFFYRASISLKRKGDGYYDFLGIKNRDDAMAIAGVDLKQVARLKADLAAMIRDSEVATNRNRQVWWVKAYAGSWWNTFDVAEDPVGRKNLLVLTGSALDKVDFDHDAEEAYFHLPNGLWGVGAWDKNGKLQEVVPPEIASDDRYGPKSKDHRIHNGMSCFRCHENGLKDIDDWGRKAYAAVENRAKFGQVGLKAIDPKLQQRLKQIYLGDLPRQLKKDQVAYAERLKELNGLTPQENADGVGEVWKLYVNESLGMQELADELGVKLEVWEKALNNHVARMTKEVGSADPVLAALLAEKSQPMIRAHAEERFAIMQLIIREAGTP